MTLRREPYTTRGILRAKCTRCEGKGFAQWNVCAENGAFRVACAPCDVALNRLVLEWMKLPQDYVNEVMKAYEAKQLLEAARGRAST